MATRWKARRQRKLKAPSRESKEEGHEAALIYIALGVLLSGSGLAQQKPAEVKRLNGRPDLSGLWTYSIDLPARALKQVIDGQTIIQAPDRSGRVAAREEVVERRSRLDHGPGLQTRASSEGEGNLRQPDEDR